MAAPTIAPGPLTRTVHLDRFDCAVAVTPPPSYLRVRINHDRIRIERWLALRGNIDRDLGLPVRSTGSYASISSSRGSYPSDSASASAPSVPSLPSSPASDSSSRQPATNTVAQAVPTTVRRVHIVHNCTVAVKITVRPYSTAVPLSDRLYSKPYHVDPRTRSRESNAPATSPIRTGIATSPRKKKNR